jgi:copper transport protein
MFWLLLSPHVTLAHAELIRSDPLDQAVLRLAPQRVRLWFSEALDPAASSLTVVNDANQDVEQGDIHVVPGDGRELSVRLLPHLLPGTYTIVWQSASRQDGHLDSGTERFTIACPDGSVPPRTSLPYLQTPEGATAPLLVRTQQEDPTRFEVLVSLLETLLVTVWAGLQCWHPLVLQPMMDAYPELAVLAQAVHRRLTETLAPTVVSLLLLLQGGDLIKQMTDIGVHISSPTVLVTFIADTPLGLIWFVRVLLILLAWQLTWYQRVRWSSPSSQQPGMTSLVCWGQMVLALAILGTMVLGGHATETTSMPVPVALIGDFLHELAAALWMGGILILVFGYLPLLRKEALEQRTHALVAIWQMYAPWAYSGVGLMAVSGPLMTRIHLTLWQEGFTTPFGQVFVLKMVLVGAIIGASAWHVGWIQPRLARVDRLASVAHAIEPSSQAPDASEIGQVKYQERDQKRLLHLLTWLLSTEAVLSIGILLCAGTLTVLSG